jgi:hypothetical protein
MTINQNVFCPLLPPNRYPLGYDSFIAFGTSLRLNFPNPHSATPLSRKNRPLPRSAKCSSMVILKNLPSLPRTLSPPPRAINSSHPFALFRRNSPPAPTTQISRRGVESAGGYRPNFPCQRVPLPGRLPGFPFVACMLIVDCAISVSCSSVSFSSSSVCCSICATSCIPSCSANARTVPYPAIS